MAFTLDAIMRARVAIAPQVSGIATAACAQRPGIRIIGVEPEQGTRFPAERARLVVEPAGAAAVGALLAGRVNVRRGENVVAILSGGNLDLSRLAEILAP